MKDNGFIAKGREWFAHESRSTSLIFLSFVLITFAKTYLFNYFAFYESLLPAGSESLNHYFGSMLCKLSVALMLGALTFVIKDKRWLILVSLIIDIWCIANLVYMRNNNMVLDGEAFNQAGNIHGYFWSVLIYFEWKIDLIFVLLTALFSCIFIFTDKSDRIAPLWLITMMAAIMLRFVGAGLDDSLGNNTLTRDGREYVYGWSFSNMVKQVSIIESPAYVIADYIEMKKGSQPYHPMTRQNKFHIAPLINENDYHTSNEPLIIILVESLENWVCRPDVMPNLYALSQSEHVLYADHINTQTMGAPSADGQMIVNTGLLPINAGATCLHYPHNVYPALMKTTTEKSVCLLSHNIDVWNQREMSPAFGYDTTIVFSDIDTLLFNELNHLVDNGERHIQCITQSTHAPFNNHELSSLELPSNMPRVMRNYIRAFNAFDNGLKIFLDKLESDTILQDYTIVITGDHRILHREKRESMMRYCKKNNLDYDAGNDCLPLIIYSPHIEGNEYIKTDAYQMDIYPTVLNLIGQKDYTWRGIGTNLRDDASLYNRFTGSHDAAVICDQIIRNNYFKNFNVGD